MSFYLIFFALFLFAALMTAELVIGNVVLIGENISMSLESIEAKFTPNIRGPVKSGVLYLAEPIDACSSLMNNVAGGSKSTFALIIRGNCSFDDKIRNAQNAGFRAAIVYDFEESASLIKMGGRPEGIKIHAVFVSKSSGKVLKKYTGRADVELWILPTMENSAWAIMGVSFVALLAMSSMLATCFFVCKHHVRRERPRAPQVQKFHGMSRRLVKAMPSLIFTTVSDDKCTSTTCAICLDDYKTGERLRILPCCHKFHASCVDSWLTTWRTFCPVCKRDAKTTIDIPPASESTPLLSSGASTFSSAISIRSYNSSLPASSSIPILSTPPWSPATSRTHSLSSTHRIANSYGSYNNSVGVSNRSFGDIRNTSSQRSPPPHFLPPDFVALPLSSSYRWKYMHPSNRSSSNASPSNLVGSSGPSGRCSYLQHCESAASMPSL